MVKGPEGTNEIVVSIKRIMGMARLVPKTARRDNHYWYLNNRIDLETLNRIYLILYGRNKKWCKREVEKYKRKAKG